MAVDSNTGRSLVQEQVANFLVEPLREASVILGAPGVTVFNSSEPLRVPTLNGDMSGEWIGENELIPEAQANFGEIELMPTNRKSIKVLVRVSNELIRMAKMGVSAVLQNRIVTDVRDKLDTALLVGDGADNSVTGLVNQAGPERMTWNPEDPDTILDALAAMAGNEVTPSRIFMSGADFFKVRKLKDADGRYLMQHNLDAAATYRLHGTDVAVTNKLPEGTAIMADMSSVAVVRDTDPRVTLDASRYLDYDQTAIRVTTRYDLGVLRNEGVTILTAGE